MNLLIYIPNGNRGKVPAFMGLNFSGNHQVCNDPGILLLEQWSKPKDGEPVKQTPAEATRGKNAIAWALDQILARGALVNAYYGDIEPDFPGGWQPGSLAVIPGGGGDPSNPTALSGTNAMLSGPPGTASDNWGAIAAYAWGLSRAMDYLETDPAIDAKRVALMGHSRLGKAAMWRAPRTNGSQL